MPQSLSLSLLWQSLPLPLPLASKGAERQYLAPQGRCPRPTWPSPAAAGIKWAAVRSPAGCRCSHSSFVGRFRPWHSSPPAPVRKASSPGYGSRPPNPDTCCRKYPSALQRCIGCSSASSPRSLAACRSCFCRRIAPAWCSKTAAAALQSPGKTADPDFAPPWCPHWPERSAPPCYGPHYRA